MINEKKRAIWNRAAKKAALQFAKDIGVPAADLKHTPLFYIIVDLTTALGLLSETECKNPLGQVYEEARDLLSAIKKGQI